MACLQDIMRFSIALNGKLIQSLMEVRSQTLDVFERDENEPIGELMINLESYFDDFNLIDCNVSYKR